MVTKEVLNKIQKSQNYCMSMIQPNQNIKITAKKEKILNISSLIRLEHLKLGYRMLHNPYPHKSTLTCLPIKIKIVLKNYINMIQEIRTNQISQK